MDLLSLGEEEEEEEERPVTSPKANAASASASSPTPTRSSSAHSPAVSPSSEGARGVTGIPAGENSIISCYII